MNNLDFTDTYNQILEILGEMKNNSAYDIERISEFKERYYNHSDLRDSNEYYSDDYFDEDILDSRTYTSSDGFDKNLEDLEDSSEEIDIEEDYNMFDTYRDDPKSELAKDVDNEEDNEKDYNMFDTYRDDHESELAEDVDSEEPVGEFSADDLLDLFGRYFGQHSNISSLTPYLEEAELEELEQGSTIDNSLLNSTASEHLEDLLRSARTRLNTENYEKTDMSKQSHSKDEINVSGNEVSF